MKRHESLAPFSREHHGALILAQLLKKDAPAYKDLPTAAKDKAVYALEMYNRILKQHFHEEEQLLEKVKTYHTEIEKMTFGIIREHQELTQQFLSLSSALNLPGSLDELGNALAQHIRKEERVLFPLIQEHCPEAVLISIASSLT